MSTSTYVVQRPCTSPKLRRRRVSGTKPRRSAARCIPHTNRNSLDHLCKNKRSRRPPVIYEYICIYDVCHEARSWRYTCIVHYIRTIYVGRWESSPRPRCRRDHASRCWWTPHTGKPCLKHRCKQVCTRIHICVTRKPPLRSEARARPWSWYIYIYIYIYILW